MPQFGPHENFYLVLLGMVCHVTRDFRVMQDLVWFGGLECQLNWDHFGGHLLHFRTKSESCIRKSETLGLPIYYIFQNIVCCAYGHFLRYCNQILDDGS